MVHYLAVFLMRLTIEHKGLGHLEVALTHQSHFHLILNVFHTHTVTELEKTHQFVQLLGINRLSHRSEGFQHGRLDFF